MSDSPVPVIPPTKPEHKQISNYVGAAVIAVGNILPYLTPAFFTSLGLSAHAVQVACTIVGVLCFAYREKVPASVSPPTQGTK